MSQIYPEPQDVGIKIPRHYHKERYCSGFRFALQGGKITVSEQLRMSFREGYRAGKLYLRALRRTQGIENFPLQGKIRFRATH